MLALRACQGWENRGERTAPAEVLGLGIRGRRGDGGREGGARGLLCRAIRRGRVRGRAVARGGGVRPTRAARRAARVARTDLRLRHPRTAGPRLRQVLSGRGAHPRPRGAPSARRRGLPDHRGRDRRGARLGRRRRRRGHPLRRRLVRRRRRRAQRRRRLQGHGHARPRQARQGAGDRHGVARGAHSSRHHGPRARGAPRRRGV